MNRLILAVASLTLFSCTKDKGKIAVTPSLNVCNVSFKNDILPIMNSKCATAGCHTASYFCGDFSQYADVKQKAENGTLEYRVFTSQTMPPTGSLSQDEFQKIRCWLDSGAPNN